MIDSDHINFSGSKFDCIEIKTCKEEEVKNPINEDNIKSNNEHNKYVNNNYSDETEEETRLRHLKEYQDIESAIHRSKMLRKQQEEEELLKLKLEREEARAKREKELQKGRLGGKMLTPNAVEQVTMNEQTIEYIETKNALVRKHPIDLMSGKITPKNIERHTRKVFEELYEKMKETPMGAGQTNRVIQVRSFLLKLVPGLWEQYDLDKAWQPFIFISETHADMIIAVKGMREKKVKR